MGDLLGGLIQLNCSVLIGQDFFHTLLSDITEIIVAINGNVGNVLCPSNQQLPPRKIRVVGRLSTMLNMSWDGAMFV